MKRAREDLTDLNPSPPKKQNSEWDVTFEITHVASFVKTFELIKKLLHECTLAFSPGNGFTILNTDADNVACINLVLKDNYFSTIHCRKNTNFTVALSMFYEIISSFKTEKIHFAINDVHMKITSINKDFGEDASFLIRPVMNEFISDYKPGVNEYPFRFQLNSKRLEHHCSTMKKVNIDKITFSTQPNHIKLTGKGEIIEEVNIRLNIDQGIMLGMDNETNNSHSTTVSLHYVHTIAQASKLNKSMQIFLGPNLAFLMRYCLFEGPNQDEESTLTVFVSPIQETQVY